LSGTAVLLGVLVAYGAFAVLISLVAGFANGAHANQQLSGATWKQLGVGGGIVTAIVLFVAWGVGGFAAARLAGRDAVRHGVWVFVVGVVLMTVVGAAITWLPDTAANLKNLRLLGLPVRRTEWRDIGTVAAIASLVGMAAGAVVGGWRAAPTLVPGAPAAPPPPPPPLPPELFEAEPFEEEVHEPAFVGPSLFGEEQVLFEPEPEPEPDPERQPEPVEAETPAWLQFIQERERAIREMDRESAVGDAPPAPAPAPWSEPEPAPTFIVEPEFVEPELVEPAPAPADVGSWWPQEPEPAAQPAPAYDEAWALPDEELPRAGGHEPDESAFPPPPTPVPEPDVAGAPDPVAPPPPAERGDWSGDELFQAPPEPPEEDVLQRAPEAPLAELDPEEQAERRRQQEEAARAYKQAREEQ
jgi:hypothetical protein